MTETLKCETFPKLGHSWLEIRFKSNSNGSEKMELSFGHYNLEIVRLFNHSFKKYFL